MSLIKILMLSLISVNIYGSDLSVNSEPAGTEIFISEDANKKEVLIGKTPFKKDIEELINTYVKKNSFIITLKKKGYENYNVLFSKTTDNDVALSVNLKVDQGIKKIQEHDLLMIQLFDVQKLIRGRDLSSALAKLDTLEKKYPEFSIVAELKGTTYYMNKNIEGALTQYRKAFALNSKNSDAYKMKVYLEKKLGVYSEL